MKYLGLIVGGEGIKIDRVKVESITEWPTPEQLRDVRVFLPFANFNQRFIKGYSEIIRPMTGFMQKARKFDWGQDQKRAFEELGEVFTTAPVLARFDFERDAVRETNACDYVSA